MASFDYVGRNNQGAQVKGTIEAANISAVAEMLSRQQIIPTDIKQGKEKVGNAGDIDIGDLLGFAPVSLDDLIVFCRQMYALMKSGVPILRAINGLAESSSSAKLRGVLAEIAAQLENGFALSSALNQHPRFFSPLFISLIHVGENTGKLDDSFIKLASYFEREQETKKRIKTALRYPSFVIIALAIALVILNIFVIPTFSSLFSKLGADLPWATKALIASSNLFLNYWPHMLGFLVVTIIGVRYYLRTVSGLYRWDRFKIKLPIVGSIIERSILSRFAHSFAIVLRAGVPMTTGLSFSCRCR